MGAAFSEENFKRGCPRHQLTHNELEVLERLEVRARLGEDLGELMRSLPVHLLRAAVETRDMAGGRQLLGGTKVFATSEVQVLGVAVARFTPNSIVGECLFHDLRYLTTGKLSPGDAQRWMYYRVKDMVSGNISIEWTEEP